MGTALVIIAILFSFYVGDLLSKKFESQRLELSKEILRKEMEKNKKKLEAALEDVLEENRRLREQLALPPMRREWICINEDGSVSDLRPKIEDEDSYIRGYVEAYVKMRAVQKFDFKNRCPQSGIGKLEGKALSEVLKARSEA